jgi:hypothetical protein
MAIIYGLKEIIFGSIIGLKLKNLSANALTKSALTKK